MQRMLRLEDRSRSAGESPVRVSSDRRSDVLCEAWRRVQRSKGAAGVAKQTAAAVQEYGVERLLGELQRDLRARSYRPAPHAALQHPTRQPEPGEHLDAREWFETHVLYRLRHHPLPGIRVVTIRNIIRKPCAGKPHARIERGVRKRTRRGRQRRLVGLGATGRPPHFGDPRR